MQVLITFHVTNASSIRNQNATLQLVMTHSWVILPRHRLADGNRLPTRDAAIASHQKQEKPSAIKRSKSRPP